MKQSIFILFAILNCNNLLFSQATSLPLFQIEYLEYQGAFVIPSDTYGESNGDYSSGTIAYNSVNNSMFFAGFNPHGSIAEFTIPTLVNSTNLLDLNSATILQDYRRILDQTPDSNPQSLDRVTGMYVFGNKLIVNAIEFYDAPADNTHTSLVINNASNLATSSISGYYSFQGEAHASGWISEVPTEWQTLLGNSFITGNSSRYSINSRLPMGVSAFTFDINSFNTQTSGVVSTTTLLDFDLLNPLYADFDTYYDANYNVKNLNGTTPPSHTVDDADITVGVNNLWTEISQADYGFIVPGTRTYFTVGASGGHDSGIGYKPTQNNGNVCGGPCAYDVEDNYNYYWLWDLNDLLAVKNGTILPYNVKPYAYGEFDAPFQTDIYSGGGAEHHAIIGGTFDEDTNMLYLTLEDGGTTGPFGQKSAIIAYSININTLSNDERALDISFEIFPNPVSESFTFSLKNNLYKDLIIYNSLGQSVIKSKLKEIDISVLESGLYIVKFNLFNGNTITKRLIKN